MKSRSRRRPHPLTGRRPSCSSSIRSKCPSWLAVSFDGTGNHVFGGRQCREGSCCARSGASRARPTTFCVVTSGPPVGQFVLRHDSRSTLPSVPLAPCKAMLDDQVQRITQRKGERAFAEGSHLPGRCERLFEEWRSTGKRMGVCKGARCRKPAPPMSESARRQCVRAQAFRGGLRETWRTGVISRSPFTVRELLFGHSCQRKRVLRRSVPCRACTARQWSTWSGSARSLGSRARQASASTRCRLGN